MQLRTEQLIPIPLREKLINSTSAIWKRNLTFQQGDYIFLQAPSGTGKTTLVHFLYGLRKDHEGSIYWDQQNMAAVKDENLSALRSSDISIIFQDMRLFPELTAWGNLEIKRSLTNTVTQDTVAIWMQRLGIEHKKDSLAGTLSYGEQQRVAIIRALLQPYKWLLMDEPFSHLDHANIEKAAALIQEVTTANNAGLIIADLEDNDYFPYTQKLVL